MLKWDRSKGRPEPIAALNRIPERESGEPLVDMREACPTVRFARPAVIPYCRAKVAEMAEAAALRLPEGIFLGLVEAWRPIERQQRIYDFMLKSAQEAFPDRDHAAIRRTICRWVAPTDQKAPPGHCTGGALDVWLLDADGEQLDVTSPHDRFRAARTYTLDLSEAASRNRQLLLDAMLGVGFSNCRDEWWHYSYGDAGWAVRLGYPECFYGRVSMEPSLYAQNELEWIEAAKERKNPFV